MDASLGSETTEVFRGEGVSGALNHSWLRFVDADEEWCERLEEWECFELLLCFEADECLLTTEPSLSLLLLRLR